MNCHNHKDRKAEVYITIGKIVYMCCAECAETLITKPKDKDEKD